MTIDQLIAREQEAVTAALAKRKEHTDTVAQVRAACEKENRDPTEAEETQIREASEAKATLDTEVKRRQDKVTGLEREKADDEAADTLSRESKPAAERPSYDRVARVGAEARTYRPDNDRTGGQFLLDVARSFLYNEPGAQQRLAQHMAEERVERGDYLSRAAGTGAFAGLTVPQYLVDMKAPLARAVRPFADACNKHALPDQGMTLNISRITTGTSVALQASENSAVSETNIDDTLLTVNVQTAAGQQTLSRQAIDRSTGAEDVMLDDLFRAYNTTLDSTLINQASTGLTNVATDTNYTDASPTAAELWPKLLGAQAAVEAALLNVDTTGDVAVMHSRRWAWLQSQVGPNWPFIAQMNSPVQAGGQDNGRPYGAGYRGNVAGLNVIVDNNIATNYGGGTEDEIYVVNVDECHLWEDPQAPVLIRAEQAPAATLGVLFVVYGYFAYTFARYAHAQKISDTGLIAPVF